VRVETGVRQGDEVSVYYDPMIAKLVVWDKDRTSALRRLRQNLQDYQVVGLSTNIAFLDKVTEHPAFVAADIETNFIQRYKDDLLPATQPAIPTTTIALAVLSELLRDRQRYSSGDISATAGMCIAAHSRTRTHTRASVCCCWLLFEKLMR